MFSPQRTRACAAPHGDAPHAQCVCPTRTAGGGCRRLVAGSQPLPPQRALGCGYGGHLLALARRPPDCVQVARLGVTDAGCMAATAASPDAGDGPRHPQMLGTGSGGHKRAPAHCRSPCCLGWVVVGTSRRRHATAPADAGCEWRRARADASTPATPLMLGVRGGRHGQVPARRPTP